MTFHIAESGDRRAGPPGRGAEENRTVRRRVHAAPSTRAGQAVRGRRGHAALSRMSARGNRRAAERPDKKFRDCLYGDT